MNLTELVLLTICLTGVQFTWSVELAYGTPYLLSLGLPKALTALVWLAGPLSGLLIQPIVGVYSDKCTFKMGRRRPFMIGGGALVVISIAMIAYSREIAEWFWSADNPDTAGHVKTFTILVAVTAFYFLDFSINAVQASCRSLIVDVAPLQQQETANAWGARMIGVGNVIGYFVGYLDLPTFFPFLGNTQLKVLCWLAALWFSSTLATTCWYVKEKRFAPEARHLGRQWYAPMVDIVHAMRNLPGPVQDICNVQFFAWLGVFPFLFYRYEAAMSPAPAPADGDMDGTRAGSFALLLFAIVSLFTGFVLPLITVRKDESESDDSHAHGLSMLRPKTWTKLLQLPPVWATSTWFFAILMFATWWINTVSGATALIALVGVSWGVMMWVPMALLGEAVSYYSINPGAVTSTSDEAGYATVPSEENLFPPTSTGAGTTRPADRPQLDAGLVLGIHNVYVVLPQFLSTFLSSVVFAVIGWIAKSHGPPPASPVPPPSDSLPAFDEGIGPDPYDAVGWVLRVGALSSLIAGYMAWKVREVRGDGKMNNNEILVSAH
ncbi:major facilitator superfamily domain-containing protein [Gaertneriomyces semiglobifer]|nr:major facilitator superfamily domain-containing protein [Gaertneriomyces semiglobifer]